LFSFFSWPFAFLPVLSALLCCSLRFLPSWLIRELRRILESTELWDKKTWALQVTDATERTIQIRALMSARNGSAAFDLRCYVRENLVQFLKNKYPLALPQQREQQFTARQN